MAPNSTCAVKFQRRNDRRHNGGAETAAPRCRKSVVGNAMFGVVSCTKDHGIAAATEQCSRGYTGIKCLLANINLFTVVLEFTFLEIR